MHQRRTLTKELLIFLATETLGVAEYWIDANISLGTVFKEWNVAKRARHRRQFERRLRQALYNLEKQGSIIRKKKGEKLYVSLTNKGHMSVLRSKLQTARKHPEGFYTIVFFDIPEELRHVRALFRRLLKEGGFRQWQQSVWVSERDVLRIIQEFSKMHGIMHWVAVCTTQQIVGAPQEKF